MIKDTPQCPNKFCRYLVRYGPPQIAEWYCHRNAPPRQVPRFAPWATCPDYEPFHAEDEPYYGST